MAEQLDLPACSLARSLWPAAMLGASSFCRFDGRFPGQRPILVVHSDEQGDEVERTTRCGSIDPLVELCDHPPGAGDDLRLSHRNPSLPQQACELDWPALRWRGALADRVGVSERERAKRGRRLCSHGSDQTQEECGQKKDVRLSAGPPNRMGRDAPLQRRCAPGLRIAKSDWGATPFARRSGHDPARISASIERFNEVNRQEALKANVQFIDITPASRRAASEASLLAPDGLHYAGPMYLEWVRLALPAAADAISTRRR